jgi:two-component system sensor kinase FixL
VAYLSFTGTDDKSGEEDSHMNLQSHRCLQATVNASFDAMFTIDHNGTILLTNQAAVRLFGYDSVDDFFGHNVSMICGRDHASQHDEYLRRYLTTGVAHIIGGQRRVLAARRDGTEFPIELGIVELPSDPSSSERYFSAYIRDLTELEAQQAMALEKENRTQTLINASFDPMVEIDQRGVILLTNNAMINLFGYSRDELIGSNISKICGGDHGGHHDAYLQRYLETGKSAIIGRKRDTVARRKDGSDFPIELAVQQVKLANGEWIFCGFIRDLTTQKLMQQHLVRQERLIQNQFFQGGHGGDAGSAENGTTPVRPRRPKRSPAHVDHSNGA